MIHDLCVSVFVLFGCRLSALYPLPHRSVAALLPHKTSNADNYKNTHTHTQMKSIYSLSYHIMYSHYSIYYSGNRTPPQPKREAVKRSVISQWAILLFHAVYAKLLNVRAVYYVLPEIHSLLSHWNAQKTMGDISVLDRRRCRHRSREGFCVELCALNTGEYVIAVCVCVSDAFEIYICYA